MIQPVIAELTDCSEFRQTLESRPPAVVHGFALSLILIVLAAVGWAAWVEADIVVKTHGRVRPVDQPARVFAETGTQLDGHVAEVLVSEGTPVSKGQVLLRLDTARLDNEIAKQRRRIAASDQELVVLHRLDRLVVEQYESAQAKARAELEQAEDERLRAGKEQASRIRSAESQLAIAEDRYVRYRRLVSSKAITAEEYVEAKNQVRQDREKLKLARLALDDGHVEVLRRAFVQVRKDFAVQRAEVDARKVAKQADGDAAGKELANLELELGRAVLRSPIDGVVVSGEVKPGDVLATDTPVFEVAKQEGFHFEASIPSEDVGGLEVGMPVKIKFDAYDYQRYGTLQGTVCFIAPDSRLIGKSNGPTEAVAYIARVELHGAQVGRGELLGSVKLGLGGTAEIVVDRESILTIFLKKLRGTISLS